jgi:T5orf172 domain
MKRPRPALSLPRYVRRKPLNSGGWGYFFDVPTTLIRAGCPVRREALGTDYPKAVARAETVLLPALDEWMGNGRAVSAKRLATAAFGADDSGYVYFLRRAGEIKIGWSKNPFRRADDLKTGASDKVKSLVALNGTRRHEKLLHRQFERHRRNGEWFTAAPALAEFIARCVMLGHFEFEPLESVAEASPMRRNEETASSAGEARPSP